MKLLKFSLFFILKTAFATDAEETAEKVETVQEEQVKLDKVQKPLPLFTLLEENTQNLGELVVYQSLNYSLIQATSIVAPFLEQFANDWTKRWIPSQAKKDGSEADAVELLQYRGEWNVEESFPKIIENDLALALKTLAAHSAIAAKFDEPIDPTDKTLVVQYDIKFQNGLECGGAYMKLLTFDQEFDAAKFGDKSPYTIMFGPDKCGGNDKVHFIFRHKNPITGEIEEKHLTAHPASGVQPKKSTLYTLVVRPDQTFDISVNNVSVKKGSLLEDFTPAVNPPKEVDDVTDKKPEDWVDEANIVDPTAVKPEDWDEDAPQKIPDLDAKQPEDWLVDEPATVPDATATKPEDWDDEEDGDWAAPVVANPKCEKVSGCGEWTRPDKANPAYKGKWAPNMIDNPAYKGEWKPKKVPNPNYFDDKTPSNFGKMGAIGFELWSMQNGFLFDNIYIGHSEADAKTLAEETWAVKIEVEKEVVPEIKAEEEAEKEKAKEAGFMNQVRAMFLVLQEQMSTFFVMATQKKYVEAVKEMPHILGLLIFAAAMPFYLVSLVLSPKKKAAAKKEEKEEKIVKAKAISSTIESIKATQRMGKGSD